MSSLVQKAMSYQPEAGHIRAVCGCWEDGDMHFTPAHLAEMCDMYKGAVEAYQSSSDIELAKLNSTRIDTCKRDIVGFVKMAQARVGKEKSEHTPACFMNSVVIMSYFASWIQLIGGWR